MININDIKIGQKAWFHEYWSQMIVWGRVTKITKFDNNEDGIEVRGEVYEKGSAPGTTTQPLDNLYATKEEAIEAIRKSNQAQVDTYKKEITDIASLVAFPITHPFGMEEYTDYEAIRAYRERAKELGFEIPD